VRAGRPSSHGITLGIHDSIVLATGALTDQLMRHRVTGTLGDPKITPEIAGHLFDFLKGKGGET